MSRLFNQRRKARSINNYYVDDNMKKYKYVSKAQATNKATKRIKKGYRALKGGKYIKV